MTLDAIKQARKSGDLSKAFTLIAEEAKRADGKLSSLLGDQYALTLMAGGSYDRARDVFLLLANQFPEQAATWRAVGQCSDILGDYEAAKSAFRSAIDAHAAKNQPDECRSYFGYGSQVFRLGDPDNGEHWWREGLTKSCDSPDAKVQRGHVLLCFGEYEQGWASLESRRELVPFRNSARGHGVDLKALEPEWDGKAEGTVHVYGDQGAGDAILFSRWLREMPNPYKLQVGEPLRRLLDGYAHPPKCDWSIPLSSLPHVLRAPGPLPPADLGGWARPKNQKPRVGICWQGAKAYLNDKDRSCPFDPRPLMTSYKWDLFSVQVGTDFDSPDYRWNADFLRTLDAVITVDTSTAHLAASLGMPTILITQSQPFWCWGIRGATSQWYPSATIIRRHDVNEWEGAWFRAKQKLQEMA